MPCQRSAVLIETATGAGNQGVADSSQAGFGQRNLGLVRQGPGEPEARQDAGVGEEGDGGDPVAVEREHH